MALPCRLGRSALYFFFFNDTATTEIYTLSLHDALPIKGRPLRTAWDGTRRLRTAWGATSRFERRARPSGRAERFVRRARRSGRAEFTGSRARAAAMELRSQRTRRSVQAPGMERHERAAPQPAVSRPAHAARAASRRLHRLGERFADGAGLPAGGARRAARNRVAGDAGLRPHRHPRHQPRL